MKSITVEELKAALDNASAILIDVRETHEYQAEHIEDACLIPLSTISLEKLPTHPQIIVIQCRSGKRSLQACEKLLAQNPELNIFNLEGGIEAWKKAGYPVQCANHECTTISIERQTQIVAGSLVFLSVLLGMIGHPAFYILSGFFGLGLIFAGITGWCGMAKLLTYMPWNRKG